MTDNAAKVLRLQRRLEREKSARKQAESLLMEKSLALYEALELGKQDRNKLELAVWAGNESIWDWNSEEQIYELMSYPAGASDVVRTWGNTAQVVRRIHPSDRQNFVNNWQLFLSDVLDSLDILLRYRLPSDPYKVQSKEKAMSCREHHELSQSGFEEVDITVGAETDQNIEQQGDHSWRWLHWRGRIVERDKHGTPTRAVGTVKDVTTYRRTQQSYLLMAQAFANSRDAMVICDQHGHIREANQSFHSMFRITPASANGESLAGFVEMPQRQICKQGSNHSVTCETQSTDAISPLLPLEISLNHFQPEDSSEPFSIITLRDLTERKRSEDALMHMASHDGLTDLPNRGALHEHLEAALPLVSARHPLAVMFIDLDGFKAVNDEFGHIAADMLLISQARRLKRLLPENGFVARWGGDEFVMVWQPQTNDLSQDHLPSHVLRTIREPLGLNGASIRLSASIGIVEVTGPTLDANELIRCADSAMYEAKSQGRNRIQVYSQGMGKSDQHRASLISELSLAIEQDRITFFVQPKFDAN